MGVFDFLRPKWKHPDPEVRQAAVSELRDQTRLAEIAKTDKDLKVRETAVRYIQDQTLLAEIAKTDKDSRVRESAFKYIRDHALLTTIALSNDSEDLRVVAIEKIEDEATLAGIVKKDVSERLRSAVENKLEALKRSEKESSLVYDSRTFGGMATMTMVLKTKLELSVPAKRAWRASTGDRLSFSDPDMEDMLTFKEIVENLTYRCGGFSKREEGCGQLFTVVSMNPRLDDGRIAAEGNEYDLSELKRCPLCGSPYVRIIVKKTSNLWTSH